MAAVLSSRYKPCWLRDVLASKTHRFCSWPAWKRDNAAISQIHLGFPRPRFGDLVVWNMFIFPYIENHNPNWRTHIFQKGRSTTNQFGDLGPQHENHIIPYRFLGGFPIGTNLFLSEYLALMGWWQFWGLQNNNMVQVIYVCDYFSAKWGRVKIQSKMGGWPRYGQQNNNQSLWHSRSPQTTNPYPNQYHQYKGSFPDKNEWFVFVREYVFLPHQFALLTHLNWYFECLGNTISRRFPWFSP